MPYSLDEAISSLNKSIRATRRAAGSYEDCRAELTRALGYCRELGRLSAEMTSRAALRGDTYKPTAAIAANAKQAIKWREEGKAHGAGTAVGWTRAAQLAKRQPVSFDTVKRMLAYFTRHEVDKQSPHWDDPSKGKVMWMAWGGDEGYDWSKAIVEKVKKEQEGE